MLTVAHLRKRPEHFRAFTGLEPAQFDVLLSALTPVYEAQERARKSRPTRERAIGAGHRFHLRLPERLLMTLFYLRLYPSQMLLGYLFGLDESNVSRERTRRMLPALLEVLPVPMRKELGLVGAAADEPPPEGAPSPEPKTPSKKAPKKRRPRPGASAPWRSSWSAFPAWRRCSSMRPSSRGRARRRRGCRGSITRARRSTTR